MAAFLKITLFMSVLTFFSCKKEEVKNTNTNGSKTTSVLTKRDHLINNTWRLVKEKNDAYECSDDSHFANSYNNNYADSNRIYDFKSDGTGVINKNGVINSFTWTINSQETELFLDYAPGTNNLHRQHTSSFLLLNSTNYRFVGASSYGCSNSSLYEILIVELVAI